VKQLFCSLQFNGYLVTAVKTLHLNAISTRRVSTPHLQHLNRRENIVVEKTAKSGGITAADFKRVSGFMSRLTCPLDEIANKVNTPGNKGFRLLPIPGETVTEIEALKLLTGVKAEMIAAGGISGAEGGVWLNIMGTPEQILETEKLIQSVAAKPPFIL
jgi:hypothetical protein